MASFAKAYPQSFAKSGRFKLSSGRHSTYLFQVRQTTMLPEGAALLGEIILEYLCRHSIECIGGLEIGAVPLVSSVAVMSHIKGSPINAFLFENQPRNMAHGKESAGICVRAPKCSWSMMWRPRAARYSRLSKA